MSTRTWPLRAYLAILLLLFVGTIAGSAAVLQAAHNDDLAAATRRDAEFLAELAASDISSALATMRSTVDRTAAIPAIRAVFDVSSPCNLQFGGVGAFTTARLDLVAADGSIPCSSDPNVSRSVSHTGASWLGTALTGPGMFAPVVEPATARPALVVSAPVPGLGVVAIVTELTEIGTGLAARYGGPRDLEFLVTTADGRTVLTRSIDPSRWAGASADGTPFDLTAGTAERLDLDGTPRVYGAVDTEVADWQVFAGAARPSAGGVFPALSREDRRPLYLLLLGLLAGTLIVYRAIATPLSRLSRVVVGAGSAGTVRADERSGPTEVARIARDFNRLMDSVLGEVAERRDAEQRARALAAIVESSVDAVIAMTTDGVVTQWNPAAERLYGYAAAEMVGRPIATLVPATRADEVARLLDRVSRGERMSDHETVRQRKDGGLIDVSLSISPLNDAEGRVVGVATIARDITDRRRNDRALAALREVAFEAGRVLEPSRLAEFTVQKTREVLDIETAALYWFEPSADLLSLMARDTVGAAPALQTVHPGEGLSGWAFQQREPIVLNDYHSWQYAITSATIASGMAVPLMVGERVVGTLLVSSNTPRTFTDRDLHFLQLFASEVASALETSRLLAIEQQQQVTEQASRAKSEFLANMSHELRTPLNAIMGFADLLAEQVGAQLSEAQRRYLRNVRASGEHLLALINDVLDLAKVEAGRLELRPEVVRLAALLEPVVASTRTSAEAAGLTFEVTPMDAGLVRADPARLRQILYNLLSNAVKFTPRGGSVRLAARFEDQSLVLEVADTGLGIPSSERHRLFGSFERLHEGQSEVAGTGLGLALTKQLVELHRGSIAFESDEGRGTTFRVVLPEALVETVHGDRILVVEDIAADAELIVAIAREAGLPSEVVTTARAAIDAVRTDPPRGVVLDLRLPDDRGERVLEALRAAPATRALPVVVVTVEDDDGRSRRLGADDHLTKPLDRARLTAWLERISARTAREEAPPATTAG